MLAGEPLDGGDGNLDILVVYSFTVTDLTEKNTAESIKSVPQPTKEKIMTTYDRLIRKGKREGIIQGKVKPSTRFTMLASKFPKLPGMQILVRKKS